MAVNHKIEQEASKFDKKNSIVESFFTFDNAGQPPKHTSKNECYAMVVTNMDTHTSSYYIKANRVNKLCDPFDTTFQRTRVSLEDDKFIKVDRTCYDTYMEFLTHRKPQLLLASERLRNV